MCSWKERLGYLVKQNKFVEALELAVAFYRDTALAAAGLPADRPRRMAEVRAHALTLLEAYADLALAPGQCVGHPHPHTREEGHVSPSLPLIDWRPFTIP